MSWLICPCDAEIQHEDAGWSDLLMCAPPQERTLIYTQVQEQLLLGTEQITSCQLWLSHTRAREFIVNTCHKVWSREESQKVSCGKARPLGRDAGSSATSSGSNSNSSSSAYLSIKHPVQSLCLCSQNLIKLLLLPPRPRWENWSSQKWTISAKSNSWWVVELALNPGRIHQTALFCCYKGTNPPKSLRGDP